MSKKAKKDSWFKGRLSNILFGLFVIGSSLFFYTRKGDYVFVWGHPIPKSTEIPFLIVGILFLLSGILRKVKDSDKNPYTLICTKCFKIYEQSDVTNNRCPKCDGNVESVKEFYERNPDFMKKNPKNGEI